MDHDACGADRERAFLELLETHAPRMRRIASSFARGEDARDLYQEIVCALWKSLPAYRGEAALGTWVYRVALNTALSHVRLRQRRPAEVQAAEQTLADAGTIGEPGREDAILQEFLASLGEIDRSLLILYLDGFSHERMSEVTGLSVGAIGVRLHRMKRAYENRYLEARA